MDTNMIICHLLLVLLTTCLQGTSGAEWAASSPVDGATLYICDGGDLALGWETNLSPGDKITTVEWFSKGRSEEMIALAGFGRFTATPAFSGRVQAAGSAGIVVSGVTTAEAGNFSVVINVNANGLLVTMKRMVLVVVKDGLMTTDGQLHAALGAPAYDDVTGTWRATVTCGHFLYGDTGPPFHLEWITAGGKHANSSAYLDGHFALWLASPVEGGSVTCLVPPAAQAAACLRTNASASVAVNAVMARLDLLEAEHAQLTALVASLTSSPGSDDSVTSQHVADLERQVAALAAADAKVKANVTQTAEVMEEQVANLTQLVAVADARNALQVAGTAQQLDNVTQQAAALDALVKDDVTRAVAGLQDELTSTKARLTAQDAEGKANTAHQLTSIADQVDAFKNEEKDDRNILEQQVLTTLDVYQHEITGLRNKSVAFSAVGIENYIKHLGETLIWHSLLANKGGAFNRTTGRFVVPQAGYYYMSVSVVGTGTDGSEVLAHLQVDGSYGDRPSAAATMIDADNHHEAAQVQMVRHLNRGQRVEVVAYSSGVQFVSNTNINTFTAFLVKPDHY